MKEELINKRVEYFGNKALLEAALKHGETLGFRQWGRASEDNRYLHFTLGGDMPCLTTDTGAITIPLEEFFNLKPEPKTKTITLEVTEDQEKQIKEQLGIS